MAGSHEPSSGRLPQTHTFYPYLVSQVAANSILKVVIFVNVINKLKLLILEGRSADASKSNSGKNLHEIIRRLAAYYAFFNLLTLVASLAYVEVPALVNYVDGVAALALQLLTPLRFYHSKIFNDCTGLVKNAFYFIHAVIPDIFYSSPVEIEQEDQRGPEKDSAHLIHKVLIVKITFYFLQNPSRSHASDVGKHKIRKE